MGALVMSAPLLFSGLRSISIVAVTETHIATKGPSYGRTPLNPIPLPLHPKPLLLWRGCISDLWLGSPVRLGLW